MPPAISKLDLISKLRLDLLICSSTPERWLRSPSTLEASPPLHQQQLVQAGGSVEWFPQTLAISYTPLVNTFVAIPHCGRTMVVTSTERPAFAGQEETLNRPAGMHSRISSINVDRKGAFWDIMEGIGIGMDDTIRWLLVEGVVKDWRMNKSIAYHKSILQNLSDDWWPILGREDFSCLSFDYIEMH